MTNRSSVYSSLSGFGDHRTDLHASQISTTTLLTALHEAYTSKEPYTLDASTSLVVNTWLQSEQNGKEPSLDSGMATRAWEHARRRAEDGCIALFSLHQSAPSCLAPMISKLPLKVPGNLYAVLGALRPFISHTTPFNAHCWRAQALAVNLEVSLEASVVGASVTLSSYGMDSSKGLLDTPRDVGYRAFDVFYYLLSSISTAAEQEFLGLKEASAYYLLNGPRSTTPPSYIPAADDVAAAEDLKNDLTAIGISGADYRNILTFLAALLKLGNTLEDSLDGEEVDNICEDVAVLLDVNPEVLARKCSTSDRSVLISGLYESFVDWLLRKANESLERELKSIGNDFEDHCRDGQDTISITVVEITSPEIGRAFALRNAFDATTGINSEMTEDGIEIESATPSVLKDMTNAVELAFTEYGPTLDAQHREREYKLQRKTEVLGRVYQEVDDDSFLKVVLDPISTQSSLSKSTNRFELGHLLSSNRVWSHLNIHPTDEFPNKINEASKSTSWSAASISKQIRRWRLSEWSNRRNRTIDFTADFDIDEFAVRYAPLGCMPGRDGVESWLLQRGWSNGEAVVGHERVWIHEDAWWEAETMLDLKQEDLLQDPFVNPTEETDYSYGIPGANGSGFFPDFTQEETQLLPSNTHGDEPHEFRTKSGLAPTITRTINTMAGDYGLGGKGDDRRDYDFEYDGEIDPEIGQPKHIISQSMSMSRKFWTMLVWAFTFWIPSFLLRHVGRMKRRDVRMAWREKLTLVALIALLNAFIVFYIIAFGNLLCPNQDKAWNPNEVATHQGANDFYVSFQGGVYDLSNFWEPNHSDISGQIADKSFMEAFAGQNVDNMFTPPLNLLCSRFVSDNTITLARNNTPSNSNFFHVTGSLAVDPNSKLHNNDWWTTRFIPKMKSYYKGDLVYSTTNVTTQGADDDRYWVILNGKIYDLTDYFYTLTLQNNLAQYNWLPEEVSSLVKSNAGKDITSQWGNTLNFTDAKYCFDNVFAAGIPDFRLTPRCQVNQYILLSFTIIICAVILIKFLSALQFGSKRRPQLQDKFVIMQVPAYTEGEEALRKSLDSLTALQYDNKRKLICVVCDGMITGGGNDRPTPKIVLDILGVDPRSDPPALPFKSVGQGSEQLNYGKVYSGLYEFEGNVVPYIVIVKVGKDSEQRKSKPGNRGKRDSQILLMRFLNRVHHRSPMSPLELEIFHQINNIIGVDPELYEYLFMVDADTSVREDSLNRLVAACANDSKIAGICGETSLENEGRSLWTMIQVYEYYISHHLAKAFESLFGSVTCLPGCFCMYRLRTADKGRPLIISDKVVDEYSDIDVDTLHKKNLLSLGEDRYLTTLMTKHFPTMSYKFVPDAFAATAAPETWSVLLSQRRRWINSTIHNLAELVWLKDLCGFCCFSMRFVVFIDLFGTIILPATTVYLGYLIYMAASHTGQFPLLSLILLAAVYGLQAIIFILKRQWQHIGWMIIYLLAFPIYSFLLPIYSFWKQDDFSWGNTRIVIGEKGNKQIIATQDDGYDPRSVPLQRWDDYAYQHDIKDQRGVAKSQSIFDYQYTDNVYEMDEMRSVYTTTRPPSTVLTGFPQQRTSYMTPQHSRQSTAMSIGQFRDRPQYEHRLPSRNGTPDPWHSNRSISGLNSPAMRSQENLLISPAIRAGRSPLGSRPVSAMDVYDQAVDNGLGDIEITEAIRACLAEVDLDSVTKKQVKVFVEQKLQCQLTGEQREFLDRQIDVELANMDM